MCQLLLRLSQKALSTTKFAYGKPVVQQEESKGEDEAGLQGDEDQIDENLENKELPGGEELGEAETGKEEEAKKADAEEE